jgi:hypothetical protein
MGYEERPVEMPLEWGGAVPTQAFVDEARKIIDKATWSGLTLRLMGGVAIRIHCEAQADMAKRLGRLAVGSQEFTDLDFMSYRKHRDRMKAFFAELGYSKRRATLSSAASERQIYFHPKGWFHVDVFFDKLKVANHPLDFRGRLELDSPTIPVTDLLLEKLQIVSMGEKDAKDAILLLSAHDSGDGDPERIDTGRIASLLSSDWGFCHTVTTNLKGLQNMLPNLSGMTMDERQNIGKKTEDLLVRIEREPKTSAWRLRAIVGTRKRWYEVVETTETVGEFGIWRLLEKPAKQETTTEN